VTSALKSSGSTGGRPDRPEGVTPAYRIGDVGYHRPVAPAPARPLLPSASSPTGRSGGSDPTGILLRPGSGGQRRIPEGRDRQATSSGRPRQTSRADQLPVDQQRI
jgi:hypothetical protein